MSLKAFHLFFIVIATLFLLCLGAWSVQEYRAAGGVMPVALGCTGFAGGVVLLIYGRWFLRKLRRVSYV